MYSATSVIKPSILMLGWFKVWQINQLGVPKSLQKSENKNNYYSTRKL